MEEYTGTGTQWPRSLQVVIDSGFEREYAAYLFSAIVTVPTACGTGADSVFDYTQ